MLLRMTQLDDMDEWQWTGNGIGDGGVVALSHVLKSEEAVLASISLYGVFPFCQSPSFVDVFARGMLCDVCGNGNRKQDWGSWCECVV